MFVGCRHGGNLGIVDFVAHGWPAIRAARPEAAHHGRAVVATPFSVRGMPSPRLEPWVLADGWPAFTRATLDLLADGPRRHRMERAGLRYARDEYGEQRVDSALSAALSCRPARRHSPIGRG